MASMLKVPPVLFLETLDQYCFDRDLTCKFKLSDSYEFQRGDRLALFKLGWTNITEYIAIKSISEVLDDRTSSVSFSKHLLPKNSSDLYQFCYINGQELHGASTPFQFCAEDTDFPIKNKVFSLDGLKASQSLAEKEDEIIRLKEENSILRESLKILLNSKGDYSGAKNYDKDIDEIKDLVENVKSVLAVHDKDIKMLKNKITEGGEEYKKLYLEKMKVQKKYEQLKMTKNKPPVLSEDHEAAVDNLLDIGDLKSMPPFPSILKPYLKQ